MRHLRQRGSEWGSLPYIGTEASGAKASRFGSKSPNLSARRSCVAVGVIDQERLLVREGFTWLCLGVLIRLDS